MRFLVGLIAIALLVVIVLLSFGFLRIGGTPGALPTFKVEGGAPPHVTANMATVKVGTETKTVEVPTIKVEKPVQPTPAPAETPAP